MLLKKQKYHLTERISDLTVLQIKAIDIIEGIWYEINEIEPDNDD